MTSKTQAGPDVRQAHGYWIINYSAMAGPCEVLIRNVDRSEARQLASLAFGETIRIEQKFSRYLPDSIVTTINTSKGRPVAIDDETRQMLDFAHNAYLLSEGMFDITSGVLREAWTFLGQEVVPDHQHIAGLLRRVGWRKLELSNGHVKLPAGMQIDLGGIGKEYAADRVAQVLYAACGKPLMVNFGGDIRAIGATTDTPAWDIGVESPDRENSAVGLVSLRDGAVATSGNARRYCYVDGKRLGHILNPLTGWPVEGAPRSVTVIGDFCLEAGLLATLAILHGREAEDFLHAQNVKSHCVW